MAATSCTPDSSGFYLLLDKALQFTPNEVHTPDYSLSSLDWERLPQPTPEAPPCANASPIPAIARMT